MARIRFSYVLRIIKFGLPLAAMFCFGALGSFADAAPSKKSSSSSKSKSASSSGKKSSASKKSKSRSSAKASKSKGKQRSAKREAAPTSAALDWIDDLPEVEVPEASGPVEDELLEPVPESPTP